MSESTVKKYTLVGLGCADCAAKMETEISNLNSVDEADLNFSTSILRIRTTEFSEELESNIKKIVRSIEPSVEVLSEGIPNAGYKIDKLLLTRLILSIVLFATALLLRVNGPLPVLLFVAAYLISGYDIINNAFKNIIKGSVFDENFLMTIASLGAFIIGEYPEGVAVMIFYQIGEFFQTLAVERSRRSISGLMNLKAEVVNLLDGSTVSTVKIEDVSVGQLFVLKPGDRVPLDGVIIDGKSSIDTTALTGESIPNDVAEGDGVLSGTVNLQGVLTVQTTKVYSDSTVAKILDLVQNASSKKAMSENFITTFAKYYTPSVVALTVLIALLGPVISGSMDFASWFHRALVLLVISCPCALVVSIPLTYFGGIGGASKNGILIKGSNYLEALSKVSTIVFDKTGTLTMGTFKVNSVYPVEISQKDRMLTVAAALENLSTHPIAKSIARFCGDSGFDLDNVKDYHEEAGLGITANYEGNPVGVGNKKLMERLSINLPTIETHELLVYICENGEYLGAIALSDSIKSDSKEAISRLKSMGLTNIAILSGDKDSVVGESAKLLGISKYFSELLPQEKVAQIEKLQVEKPDDKTLVYVGDGINDAPVLARADIGIAMGAIGSAAAIEAADIVIMNDEPSKIAQAIRISRKVKKIAVENIVFALGIKAIFLLMGVLGIATMWEAVFADVGVTLLAVLNATRTLKLK